MTGIANEGLPPLNIDGSITSHLHCSTKMNGRLFSMSLGKHCDERLTSEISI